MLKKLLKLDKSKHLERIAVVGGGYIGVELTAFERLGKEVVLVDIVDTVFERLL